MKEPAQTAAPDIQLFRDVFGASPIGIAVENLEGQPLFVNPAFCSFLGFSEEELCGKHCVDFSPPEDAAKDWALFQQLRAGSIDHYQLEKRYFRRDRSLVWGRLSISLFNCRTSPLVLAMVEDITDKKAALDREHGSLETLDLVTRHMTAAVTRCSRDFRYLWVNQAYADWLQRPLDQVIGCPILEVLGKAAFEALMPYFERVLNGESIQYERETDFQGIGKRWVSATYSPTVEGNGAVDGWVAVVLDTTERHRAEEARFRHAAIVESYEDAIISKNLDAVITSWNIGAERIFGYTEAEAVGQPITILIPPDLRDEENKILERLRAGGRIEHHETKRVTKTGENIIVSLNIGSVSGRRTATIMHKLWRSLAQCLAACLALIALTIVFDRLHLNLATTSLLYVIVVVLVSRAGSIISSIVASVIAALCLAYLAPPASSFRVDDPLDVVAVITFLITSLIIAGLVSKVRKQAEKALSTVSDKVIESEEHERKRMAETLHEDIGQRLTLMVIDIEKLRRDFVNVIGLSSRMDDLYKQTLEILTDVKTLAHELHSPRLEYLGLPAVMNSFCKEFGDRKNVKIEFKSDDSQHVTPLDVSLCLFRVLQEGLHNAVQHSGVSQFEAQLWSTSDAIHLTIHDSGAGFNLENARTTGGLGLNRMRERLRLVKGELSVDSQPKQGTTIRASVPLSSGAEGVGFAASKSA